MVSIVFRKLDAKDLDLVFSLKEESWFYTHHTTIQTRDEQLAWFKTLDHHAHQPVNLLLMAHAHVDTTYPVRFGLFKLSGIDWINRTADVGWDVFAHYRGKGLGKRLVSAGAEFSFYRLNLRRLTAEILAHNVKSMQCAKHAGFVLEGTKRAATFKSGDYFDSHVMGLLQSEFTPEVTEIDYE